MGIDGFDAGGRDQRYGDFVSPVGFFCGSATELEVFFEKGFGPVVWCGVGLGVGDAVHRRVGDDDTGEGFGLFGGGFDQDSCSVSDFDVGAGSSDVVGAVSLRPVAVVERSLDGKPVGFRWRLVLRGLPIAIPKTGVDRPHIMTVMGGGSSGVCPAESSWSFDSSDAIGKTPPWLGGLSASMEVWESF